MRDLVKRMFRGCGIYVERTPIALSRDPAEILSIDFEYVIRDFLMARESADEVIFMQIGAFDGRSGPLCKYIKNNDCKGVLVEPQERYFKRLKEEYSDEEKIKLIKAAISHKNSTGRLYTVADPEADDMPDWAGQIASFDRENVLSHNDKISNLEGRITCENVKTYNLTSFEKKRGLKI